MPPKGKWAQGITPRHFIWIIRDQLAVCERPGGYGTNHRKVRRQEEIIWIREQGFAYVVSIIPATHNLHNYDEMGVRWRHHPYPNHDDLPTYQLRLFTLIREMLGSGRKLLVHGESVDEHVNGLMAGYLVWNGMVTERHKAIHVMERISGRQLGPVGRELVTIAAELPRPQQV